jgi:hypothetical protein
MRAIKAVAVAFVCHVLFLHSNLYGATDSLLTVRKDSAFFLPINQAETFEVYEQPDLLYEGMLSTNNDSIQRYIDLAHTVLDKVRATQNFITSIDEASKVELPVGITKTIAGITYDVAIHAIRLKPAYAELDVFMQLKLPNEHVLTFMGQGIKFTAKSGIVDDATLRLLGDNAINFNGDKVQLILKGGSGGTDQWEGTYATIDCDGFKEMSLDAQVKFSRDLLRPDQPNGTVGEGNVVTSFKATLSSWNDLIVQLDLPPFQVNGLNGVGFAVREAVFDFSDLRNAPNVNFPVGYESPQFLPGNQNLWRGFYLRQLLVRMPPEFETKGNTGRVGFEATNVLIDNQGVSGTFKGSNLIMLDQGNMKGWAFSVDTLSISLVANQLTEAGLNGKIVIPISGESTPFDYNALISTGGNYLFNVSPAEDLTFPLWQAGKVEIYEASYLDIRIVDKKFLPKANLHGRMNIAAKLSDGGQGVELANISFENLEIQSVKPYIKVGSFSFGSEALQQKMAGFPISIQNVGMRSISDTELGLDFDLLLNLTGEESSSFAADAGLTVVGNLQPEEGIQSWRYKTTQVRDILVDIDGGAYKFYGKLAFYRNDISYGDGFNGVVKAEFKPGIKVNATAIFGNVNNMRYWYADAMVNFSSGIPIFSGIGIYGFGGGAYYRMKMDNSDNASELGKSASGVVYVPEPSAGLGLKAIVSIGTHPKPEAFNGDVTFEMSFFQGGGLRHIALGGNGYFATPGLDVSTDKLKSCTDKMVTQVKQLERTVADKSMGLVKSAGSENSFEQIFGEIGEKAGKKGQLSAKVLIEYDFENSVLHGNFEMFVNVAGGLIQGVGAEGRAGWAVLHFAPQEWYVYAGTPDDRIGVRMGVGSISAATTSYFMVGTKIPGSPPPAENVSNILGGMDLDYMRDENALRGGGGFAFGAAFSVNTGNLQFLMFYARFAAGAGFDIMLKDYGDNVRCKGRSEPLGINGWYANGQAYAYFEGDVGIRVRVFGRSRSVEILSLGAAAVLQAKLPNPVWMRGIVGGRFSALGGLVKGNCKFQVTLGEECEIVGGSVLEGVKVISMVTPAEGESDVSVFNAAQGVFNMEVGKVFELVDTDDKKKSFRIKLDHFKLTDGTLSIPGTTEWNAEGDVLAFNPFDVLPPKRKIKAAVQVSFEENVNGTWQQVVVDGKIFTEVMETTFATGDAPDYIPLSNIKYSYPIVGQYNYYKDEHTDGYIKLERGQPYLFEMNDQWVQRARTKALNGSEIYFNMTYDAAQRQINYRMPSELSLSTTHTFELVNVPASKAQAIDRNVERTTAKVNIGNESTDTEVQSNRATGTIDILQEKAILTSYFRTSAYATFISKISSISFSSGWSWPIYTGIHELGMNINGPELFDNFEINRSATFDRLIDIEATTEGRWITNYVMPLVYPTPYPSYGLTIDNRNPKDVSILGTPPARAISIMQDPSNAIIDITNPTLTVPINGYGTIMYNLPLISYQDYTELRNKAASLVSYQQNAWMVKIVTEPFIGIVNGDYNMTMRYRLPGTTKVTSEKPLTIKIR